MIQLAVIIISFAVAFWLEAKHDFIISNFEQTKEESERWHKIDWWYLVFVAIPLAVVYHPVILITLASLKILVFNLRINYLFGKQWWYLSSSGFESKFKGKEHFYYIFALLGFIVSIILLCVI